MKQLSLNLFHTEVTEKTFCDIMISFADDSKEDLRKQNTTASSHLCPVISLRSYVRSIPPTHPYL